MYKLKSFLSIVKHRFTLFFKRSDYGPKVFCIGYNKTGTTSIGMALEELGFTNSSFNQHIWRNYYKKGKIDKVIRYTSKFDSCDDLPWLLMDMIPVLDKKFPKSKFIYLEREAEAWKKSFRNWAIKHNGKEPDMEKSFNAFIEHKEFVLSYFKDRMDDLLIIDVSDPNAFQKLGDFVGRKTTKLALPHYNKAH